MATIRYSVVVESGSCDPTYTRWEERVNCGHKHKTIETAQKCLEKLTRWYCIHGHIAHTPCKKCLGGIANADSTSATWYNARIHDQHEQRV
jgi:hypothetical protein